MRRVTSSVLIGLGTFLIMIAIMTRFYVYGNLAVVPDSYESTTYLQAKDATIFDAATLKPVTTDLNITSYTYTNGQTKTPDDVVAWVNATSITRGDVPDATCDPSVDPAVPGCFQQSTDRTVFGNKSGAAVSMDDCPGCASTYDKSVIVDGAYQAQAEDVVRSGQLYKMPFNTQKKDISWWDSAIGAATPMKYVGEEKVQGLDTYKFVQVIAPTKIGTQELPGSVFGSTTDVTADLMYAMTRTLWIEPVTGSPVMRTEERNQVFSVDGQTVPAFVGTITYTDDQVTSLVKDGKSQSFVLGGMKLLFPIVLIVLGIAAIVGGFLLRRPKNAGTHRPKADQKDLVTA